MEPEYMRLERRRIEYRAMIRDILAIDSDVITPLEMFKLGQATADADTEESDEIPPGYKVNSLAPRLEDLRG